MKQCFNLENICGGWAECINTKGSYICACNTGYIQNSRTGTCDDIDECTTDYGTDYCRKLLIQIDFKKKMKNLNTIWFFRSNAICVNNDGGFGCKCLAGFDRFQKYIGCSDIDECSNGKYIGCSDIDDRWML